MTRLTVEVKPVGDNMVDWFRGEASKVTHWGPKTGHSLTRGIRYRQYPRSRARPGQTGEPDWAPEDSPADV